MSDTSGLQNADSEGVPAENRPERFEGGDHDAQASEPADTSEPAETTGPAEQAEPRREADDVSGAGETGVTPEGADDVTAGADRGGDGAEPPPAEFDPAQQPSNPDLVKGTEPPD